MIDPEDPNTVYVAISSWYNDPTKSPEILKTTNGLSARTRPGPTY